MRRLAESSTELNTELSVECVAPRLCPPSARLAARSRSGICRRVPVKAPSSRMLEDGLLQSVSSHRRHRRIAAVLFALCFILSAPLFSTPNPAASVNAASPTSGGDVQLRLAQQQGSAETAILDWVLANSGPLTGDTRAGAVRVAFTITPAEGWWDKAGGGKLAWHEAPPGNVHLRIFVLDLADGRLIPGLTLRATLIDANGNEQSAPADFGWYPLINAYGDNVPIAADSSYTLRVAIDGQLPRQYAFGEHPGHTTIAQFSPVPITLPIMQPNTSPTQPAASPIAQPIAQPLTQPIAQQVAQDAPSQLPLATATAAAHEAELLKPCNAALTAAITALWQQSVAGAEQPDGDYFVGYALDFRGLAVPLARSKLHFNSLSAFTGKDDVRLELLARDSRTGRIIPGLRPQATLIAADGESYGPSELFLTWYPWLTHYEGSARIPRKGLYTLRVHFDAPAYRRWGRQSDRFAAPADVEFENVSLKPAKVD